MPVFHRAPHTPRDTHVPVRVTLRHGKPQSSAIGTVVADHSRDVDTCSPVRRRHGASCHKLQVPRSPRDTRRTERDRTASHRSSCVAQLSEKHSHNSTLPPCQEATWRHLSHLTIFRRSRAPRGHTNNTYCDQTCAIEIAAAPCGRTHLLRTEPLVRTTGGMATSFLLSRNKDIREENSAARMITPLDALYTQFCMRRVEAPNHFCPSKTTGTNLSSRRDSAREEPDSRERQVHARLQLDQWLRGTCGGGQG